MSSSNISGKDAHKFIVALTGVTCNEEDITITLTDINDTLGNNLATASTTMGLLIGDVNGDSTVDTADVSQTHAELGHPATSANFRDDVNVDGVINHTDVSIVKAAVGTSLPP